MPVEKTINNFSIKQIHLSGQCFRMKDISEENSNEDTVEVTAFGKRIVVKQNENKVSFGCDIKEFENIWVPYFDLDTDYGSIISSIDSNDSYLVNAAKTGCGIRILRQDLFEMIISFIISQRNNIKRIRKSVDLLCQQYGEKKIDLDGSVYYDFPTAKALYEADVDDLRKIGVGYRDVYIKRAAEAIYLNNFDISSLYSMSYEEARKELLTLYGVGEKVADCIALFALHKLESFPKDTHINQVLDREYKDGFDFERYKNTAGIMQQYMFYSELVG